MELTEIEEKVVKKVYSEYHAGELPADEALNILEQMINGNEVCPSCLSIITDENPLIDTERYSANDFTGYCENCYDPTPLQAKSITPNFPPALWFAGGNFLSGRSLTDFSFFLSNKKHGKINLTRT